jgi:uncharacterized delta-60 repeat protein
VETAAQPDGGTLVALNQGVTSLSRGSDGEVRRLRPDGSWDRSFGRRGVVELGAAVSADGLMVRPSGSARIVTHRRAKVTVWKIRADGRRARGFGDDGRVRLRSLAYATAAALSPAGRIAVSGWLAQRTKDLDDFATVLLTSRGRLDRGFGHRGTSPVPDGGSMFRLAFLPDGSLRAIAGPSDDESADDDPPYWVDRIRADGTYARLVGKDALGLADLATLRADAQGRLVVTGEDAQLSLLERVKRLSGNGELDSSFGTGGDAVVTVGHRFALLPDGGLLWYRAVDGTNETADGRMLIERWSPDGTATARATTPPLLPDPGQRFVAHTETLLADGSLLVGGGARAAGDPAAKETPVLLVVSQDGSSVRRLTVPSS